MFKHFASCNDMSLSRQTKLCWWRLTKLCDAGRMNDWSGYVMRDMTDLLQSMRQIAHQILCPASDLLLTATATKLFCAWLRHCQQSQFWIHLLSFALYATQMFDSGGAALAGWLYLGPTISCKQAAMCTTAISAMCRCHNPLASNVAPLLCVCETAFFTMWYRGKFDSICSGSTGLSITW